MPGSTKAPPGRIFQLSRNALGTLIVPAIVVLRQAADPNLLSGGRPRRRMNKFPIPNIDAHMGAGFSFTAGWIPEEYQVTGLQIVTADSRFEARPLGGCGAGDAVSQLLINITRKA